MRNRPLLRTTLGLVAAGGLLLGCSSDDDSLDRGEMEQTISDQLAAQFPDAGTPEISCPDEIEPEVGATGECELSVEGDDDVYPVSVEVTAIEDGRASFDAEVGDSPK